MMLLVPAIHFFKIRSFLTEHDSLWWRDQVEIKIREDDSDLEDFVALRTKSSHFEVHPYQPFIHGLNPRPGVGDHSLFGHLSGYPGAANPIETGQPISSRSEFFRIPWDKCQSAQVNWGQSTRVAFVGSIYIDGGCCGGLDGEQIVSGTGSA